MLCAPHGAAAKGNYSMSASHHEFAVSGDESGIVRKAIVEGALLVAAAVVAALVSNAVRSETRKVDWTGTFFVNTSSLIAMAPPRDPATLYGEIDAEVARRLHDSGAYFLDARRTDAYLAGHIKGARSIPVWEANADDKISAFAAKVPLDHIIVLYCSDPACEDSARLAERLAGAGFLNLYIYKAGFPDWEQRGWPVGKGHIP